MRFLMRGLSIFHKGGGTTGSTPTPPAASAVLITLSII